MFRNRNGFSAPQNLLCLGIMPEPIGRKASAPATPARFLGSFSDDAEY